MYANLIEHFIECLLYLACNEIHALYTSGETKTYNVWSCKKIFESSPLLSGKFINKFASFIVKECDITWMLLMRQSSCIVVKPNYGS